MKKLLLLFCSAFFLVSNSINAQQHLISYELIQHYTTQDVQNILNGFGVAQGVITPYYELDYYKVTYTTRNAQDTGNTIATGAIAVPTGVTCPVPILSYQHGTTSYRYGVPSYQGGSEYLVGIIGASVSGSVASMPDYLGLGDSPGFHPYVHSKSEASATIDLLRTVRELKDSLGYNLNDQLFLFGYSQGGHATMAAFRELETNLSNEFTVTACVPMSGPFDVSGVQAATITADTSYATPGYLPYVIMGQQEAYGNVYNSLSEIFKSPYDTLLPGYFDGTHGMGWINNQLPDTPNVMLDSAYFHSFLNDPQHPGWGYLKDNDLYAWAPTAPTQLFYCTADEQVFYKNSLVCEDSMHARGATHVTAVNFGNFNHADCAPICFLYGFSFFELYMDVSGGMNVNSSITDASNGSSSDGSIMVISDSGSVPYTYEWQTPLSNTSSTVSGLAPGTYEVRVSDSRGCYVNHEATVSFGSSINSIAVERQFKIMPNPAQNEVYVKILKPLSSSYNVSIIDMLGQVIYQDVATNSVLLNYDTSQLPTGTYIVRLEHEGEVYSQKLMIQH